MQIAIVASTFIGANHRISSCSLLVVSEQIAPIMTRTAMDKRTVCKAVLKPSLTEITDAA